jgi:hypothetical protein
MGLEGMDLLLCIEDGFGIRLDEGEALSVQTVGELHALVVGKLKERRTQTCLSSAVFYRLRRVLCAEVGVPRNQVRLHAWTEFVLPEELRPQAWGQLTAALQLQLPALRRPDWLGIFPLVVQRYLVMVLCALFVGVIMLPLIALDALAGPSPGPLACLGCPLVFIGMLAGICHYDRLSAPYAVAVPRDCATLRGLVQAILQRNYGRLAAEYRTVNEAEAWQALCATVGQALDVNAADLTPETRLDGRRRD